MSYWRTGHEAGFMTDDRNQRWLGDGLMVLPLDQLRALRADIDRLAAQYGARNLRIFGSVANQAGPVSDLDILVDFERGRSLLDQVGFEQDLEDLLGCSVDVVVEGGISPHIEASILRDAVPL